MPRKGLPWARWDVDTQRNPKVLALPADMRWYWWALVQEIRFRGLPGRIHKDEAASIIEGQGGSASSTLKKLTTAVLENPLVHKEGDEYVIHDFEKSNPPHWVDSRERVAKSRAKHRERLLARGVTLQPPSPEPPPSISPSNAESNFAAYGIEEDFSARLAAVSAWWHERSGEYAMAPLVEAIAKVDVPVEDLLRHLTEVYDSENVIGLAYFTSGPGMGRLRDLESRTKKKAAGQRKGKPTAIGGLVKSYAVESRKRATSA